MRTISIHLQEGFEGDSVTLKSGERIVAEEDLVTTRNQIGFAKKLDIELADDERELTVIVSRLGKRAQDTVLVGPEPFLGLTLTPAGEIRATRSAEVFCYM